VAGTGQKEPQLAIAMHTTDKLANRLRRTPEGGANTREGDNVRFRISDVFLPGSEEVFSALPPDALMEGVVVSFSDAGSESRVFAVVDVVRQQTLVVPVNKITVVPIGPESG